MAKKKDIEIVFDKIVKNALEFLNNSADEFENYPKRSLIDFITALELFIKARLLKEHWTLLLNNLDKGNYVNFVNGDLITIEFRGAIERLDRVLQEPLTRKEIGCFNALRLHRNKLVHFYNKTYSGKSQKAKLKVLTEIAEGWYHLHNLLKRKWHREFADYQTQIDNITKKIDKNKKAWQGKYNSLKEKIDKDIKNGIIVKKCPICNYLAVEYYEYYTPIYESGCLVCGQNGIWLEITCDSCGETEFVSDSYSDCGNCGNNFDKDVLRELLEVGLNPSEDYYGDIYCTECFMTESTVVELGNGEFFCMECFEIFNETTECEWCNTTYAGDIGEDTYLQGCEICDGHIGWHMDRDD